MVMGVVVGEGGCCAPQGDVTRVLRGRGRMERQTGGKRLLCRERGLAGKNFERVTAKRSTGGPIY